MRLGNADKVAKDTEVQKVVGSTSKCGRCMEGKRVHLNWGGLTGGLVSRSNNEL